MIEELKGVGHQEVHQVTTALMHKAFWRPWTRRRKLSTTSYRRQPRYPPMSEIKKYLKAYYGK